MTEFSVGSFNVKNLIGADQEYYRFESYTPEEHAWKEDWLANQLYSMNADVVAFQEIFEKEALEAVVADADRRGTLSNQDVLPDPGKRYSRKKIFEKLKYDPYETGDLFFAPNSFDGEPGNRRPGLAILSRFGFDGTPEVFQDLPEPLVVKLPEKNMDEAGSFQLSRLSRPIIKARIPVNGQTITVFNCHLKSKLGEFATPDLADFAPEADLLNYDPVGRAVGELRALVRRTAEAVVLRGLIVEELKTGNPVIVMGDFNDGDHAVSSAIVTGERPFKNYSWLRRHDAKSRSARYTEVEDEKIRESIEALQMFSAEKLFVRKSLRDMVYTSAFGGVYESIDQILLSRHFHPDNAAAVGVMDYFNVLNDHLTDGSHPEAPYNKLASDHGQIMAHLRLIGE